MGQFQFESCSNMVKVVVFLALLSNLGLCDCKKPSKLRLGPSRLVPRFDFVDNCKNLTLDGHLLNYTLETIGPKNLMVINADFELLRRTVRRLNKMIFRVQNCEDSTAVTCQYFKTFRFENDNCLLLQMKNMPWSTFTQRTTPLVHCPMHPGKYFMRNATFDMDLISKLPLPLDRYYWRIRVEGWAPDLFMCAETGGRCLRSNA